MKQKKGVKHVRGVCKQFFEVAPSRTSENAFLECRKNINFNINLQLEKKQILLLESFVNWVVQYIKVYLSYLCLFHFDFMLSHH